MSVAFENDFSFFLPCGVVLIVILAAIITEFCSTRQEGLYINPLSVLVRLFSMLLLFYVFLFFVMVSFDVAAGETISTIQVFTAYQYNFTTARGLASFAALIVAFGFTIFPGSAILESSYDWPDFAFTMITIHFIVTSSVMSEFPASGPFWISMGCGFVLMIFAGYFLKDWLETLPYHSAMADTKKTPNKWVNKPPTQNVTPITPAGGVGIAAIAPTTATTTTQDGSVTAPPATTAATGSIQQASPPSTITGTTGSSDPSVITDTVEIIDPSVPAPQPLPVIPIALPPIVSAQ